MIQNRYRLVTLTKAERDVDRIIVWLSKHSVAGAQRWWKAFDRACQRIVRDPESFGLAPEDECFSRHLRQILFRTRRGQTYRAIFIVVENEVRILRVRGPGQQTLSPEELI